MDKEQDPPKDEAVWFDLNFVPQWAKKPPGVNPYAGTEGGAGSERTGRRSEFPGRPRSTGDRGRRPISGSNPRDRRSGDNRRTPPSRSSAEPPSRPFAPPRLPVTVSFLPERAALRGVARRIQASQRAFPLLDLASFFLSKDAFYEVKIEVRREDPATEDFHLFTCRVCGAAACSRAALLAHATAEHADDHLDSEEIEEPPPSGKFVCLTRCRRGGHLIGPPNHHLYAERLADIRRRHFPRLSDDEFQSQLETVRDPDLIEQWKERVRVHRIFRRKDDPDAAPMHAAEAHAWLEAEVGRSHIRSVRRCILPAHVARKLEDPGLRRALSEAWTREERFPGTILKALRPAFRHMGLRLFRAGAHAWFVTAVAPSAVEPDHAVEPVRRILEHIAAHPGIKIAPLMEALSPGVPPEAPERTELLRHLKWLVAKGHVIEFSDGALSVPRSSNRASSRKGRG